MSQSDPRLNPTHAISITPSDTTRFKSLQELYVGITGHVVARYDGDTSDITYSFVPVGTKLTGAITQVSAATTAGGLIGVY